MIDALNIAGHGLRDTERAPSSSRLRKQPWFVFTWALFLLFVGGSKASQLQQPDPNRILVVINNQPITEGDFRFVTPSHKFPRELSVVQRTQLVQQLIDSYLLRAFLSKRKVEPSKTALDKQVAKVYQSIRSRGDEPTSKLAEFGLTEEKLRRELALPLMWTAYVRSIVTPERLRDYWQLHKPEFDGTQVRAAQIVLKVTDQSDKAQEIAVCMMRLRTVKSAITDGQQSFAQAARKHSQSPSKVKGGDLGYFTYRGRMPVSLSRPAFSLEVGEISEPIVTQFGVHLLTTTDRKPGQLSLEDARPQVLNRLAAEIRSELLVGERGKAKIDWKVPWKN